MRILDAWEQDHKPVSAAVIKADWERLQTEYDKALKADPTWQFFGGILTIDQRRYQVV
jgi:hypothetical protein